MKHSRMVVALGVALVCAAGAQAQTRVTTAWSKGAFHVDTARVLSRSNIVLGRANEDATEAMPLGNGRLGAAVWSAAGMTVQLNRADTMPGRLSAGQVVIPGLAKLTHASDYAGVLDLYRGEFRESGGGMTATAFVEPKTDALVVDVTGADASQEQTVILRLWAPRAPVAGVLGSSAWFAESWADDKNPGASGGTFGSLAVLTAVGRKVQAAVTDERTLTVRLLPDASGHFRVLVAAPHYDGKPEPEMAAARVLLAALADASPAAHAAKWAEFWKKAALIRVMSGDGVGEYMENLRAIYLYVAACERGEHWPGSQAGVADMISSARDWHQWDSSAFWHWNLRMQVAANLGAGLADLNLPYFDLYLDNLGNIRYWTRAHMHNMDGSCVPETMRFNGQGYEYEGYWAKPTTGLNCDLDSKPYYNARTRSTGAEIGLWVWRQFLVTGDDKFLEKYFPLMGASARFLLASQHQDAKGTLHTSPSNAHENQWDVTDPTTDLSAIKALYPVVDQATAYLGIDRDLAFGLREALGRTPDFPRVGVDGSKKLLPASEDAREQDMIADSYEPGAEVHNVENIGLEPVWPYGLIGDRSDEFPLAVRTYLHRPHPATMDWSFDPVQAARLDMGSEVGATLRALTEKYQRYPNGMAKWSPEDKEFYVEQSGVVALALQEALVQDYDDIVRIASALPPGWDFSGSVWVHGQLKVDVQTHDGVPTTVVLESGMTGPVTMKNPWPGNEVTVTNGKTGKTVNVTTRLDLVSFNVDQKVNYLVKPAGEHAGPFATLSGVAATAAKKLGEAQIGLFAN